MYLAFISARVVKLRWFEHQNPVRWTGPVEDAETAVGCVDVTTGRHDVPVSPSNPRNLFFDFRKKVEERRLYFMNRCGKSHDETPTRAFWPPSGQQVRDLAVGGGHFTSTSQMSCYIVAAKRGWKALSILTGREFLLAKCFNGGLCVCFLCGKSAGGETGREREREMRV